MAITITVNLVDITAYVPLMGDDVYGVAPLVIEEEASGYTGKASFGAVDSAAALSLANKQTVSIADGGTTLFAGYVAILEDRPAGADTVVYKLECQDKNILLEETAVESESYAQGEADADTIDDLFTTYLSSIDSTTYVSTLDASMEAIAFEGQTLRECLSMICERTGGRFYIDYDDYLHYFSSESNALSWNLSDDPNFSTTFPYVGLRRRVDATVIIDKVLVIGNEISGWVGTGDHEAIVWDPSIETSQGVTDRGNAVIGRYENGLTTLTCTIYKDGARAGRDVDVTNSLLGLSAETLTIRRLRMTPRTVDGAERSYALELGEAILTGAAASRAIADTLNRQAQQVSNLDDEVYDTDAPSAPTFTAGNATTGVREDGDGHQIVWIRCTWGEVSDADLDHYEIQIADNTSFNWPKVQHIQAGETREAEWVGLQGNISYYARVRAVDWVGNYSAWSPASPGYLTITTAKDSTPPADPTGLTVSGAPTTIHVIWNANSEADLSHYELQRDDDNAGSPAGNWADVYSGRGRFYIDDTLSESEIENSTPFWYRVRAVDTSGNTSNWVQSSSETAAGQLQTGHFADDVITARLVGSNEIITNAANIGSAIITDAHIDTLTATSLTISELSSITADMGILTSGEIRVGTGTPGVDFTGFRIFSSYIAGYNDDTVQFYVDSSDGKAYAGGGVVVLDENGLSVEISGSTADIRSYQLTVSGTPYTRIAGRYAAALNDFEIYTKPISGKDGQGGYSVVAPDESGRTSHLTIGAYIYGGVATAAITMTAYHDAAAGTIVFDPDSYSKFNSNVFINETANANMALGLTINQGANDDEALAFKSSDVAHGITLYTETDTFFTIAKEEGAAGGACLAGYKDADGANYGGLVLRGFLAENVDTTKSTGGRGIVEIQGFETSGTGITDTVADGNVVAFWTGRNSSAECIAILDEDGDFYTDGSNTATYDEYDDALMCQDLAQLMAGAYDRLIAHNREAFEAARIIGPTDDHGRFMVSTKRIRMLLLGAVGQLYGRLQAAERKLALLEA